MDAILFRKCLGLNDSRANSSQRIVTNPKDPEAGSTEFIDCLNVTTTSDGCVEKIPTLVTSITHSAPVTGLSAGKRLLFTDGTDTLEWTTGTTVVNRFPGKTGPMVHTPIDCRVSTATQVFKSTHATLTMAEATVGTNPGPATSMSFAKMPAFDSAFVHNANLYAVNHADPRFIQRSRDYAYDLWNLGDDFIPHMLPVLQSGAIPGVILAVHDGGVTVYKGGHPTELNKKFFPCPVIAGTLYSGVLNEEKVYGHVFLGTDGVYMVDEAGALLRLSKQDYINTLNTSYTCATMQEKKYLAFGNSICIEYDFETKTVLKRSAFSVKGAAVWNGQTYLATGSTISYFGTTIDTASTYTASLTLPLSDLGATGTKSFSGLYFTGEVGGVVTITATDNEDESWSEQIDSVGEVTEYYIKPPKGWLGNRVSFKIECHSGAFRMEELRAVFTSGKRTR
jgi:hypothetical protein